MENKKQTAVDWLIDQMFKQGYFDGNKPLSITNLDHLQHEAKEMEAEKMGWNNKHHQTEIIDEELERELLNFLYCFEYEVIPNSAYYKFDYEACAKALTQKFKEIQKNNHA